MDPHTTHSHRRRSPRRGRPSGHAVRTPRPTPNHPHSSPGALPLEPTPCDTAPVPFASLGLDPRLLDGIRDLGFAETRPIQSAVIPLVLAGRNLIACAETGSGETAAFAVPLLQRLLARPAAAGDAALPASSPASRALVLAPTRELVVQIEDEIHGLSYHTSVTSAAVYGGVEMAAQERALRAGVDIIVATPGRLMDHMRQQNANLGRIELLVLDEADRMMDMGFWPDVRRIIAALPDQRQTLLFSATMPDEVMRLAIEIMADPCYIQVGRRSTPAGSIAHRSCVVPASQKVKWLVAQLRRPGGPVLVFTRTKIGAERLARQLAAEGVRCTALHADRTQEQRRAAIEGFRAGRYKVLVATDIAARGLDIDGIHTVINFDLPDSSEAYVHRVGRTGRSNEAGYAVTLVTPDELQDLSQLEKSVGVRLESDRVDA